jgi:hypothetical protein
MEKSSNGSHKGMSQTINKTKYHQCKAEHCTRKIELKYRYCSLECGAYSGAWPNRATRIPRITKGTSPKAWYIAIDDGYVSYKYKLKGVGRQMSIKGLFDLIQNAVLVNQVIKEL